MFALQLDTVILIQKMLKMKNIVDISSIFEKFESVFCRGGNDDQVF